MLPDYLIRLFLAAGLILLGLALYRGVAILSLSRARRQSTHLEHFQPGKPAILYFTTPDCAPCRTIQRPALSRLQNQLGERLQVIEVNAYDRPDLAKRWGVLSVPTTFILDAQGQPQHVNYGVTTTDKLYDQLRQME